MPKKFSRFSAGKRFAAAVAMDQAEGYFPKGTPPKYKNSSMRHRQRGFNPK